MDIKDIFTDLINTDLSDFDLKKEKYYENSLAEIVKLVILNKKMLATKCKTNEEQSMFLDIDKSLIITNKDKEILNEYNIFKFSCANCNNPKQKGDKNKCLLRCSGCKAVKYCCDDCQLIDWRHHKLICKRIVKAIAL